MKPPLLLALSVAANLALATLVYSHRPSSASLVPVIPSILPPEILSTPEGARFNTRVDDATFVAQLRADGFPPDVIHTLVSERVKARYAERMRALNQPKEFAYWRDLSFNLSDALSREDRAAQRALNREIADEVKKLLGDEDDLFSPEEKVRRERNTGPLSSEKIQQIDALNKDYDELAAQLRDRTRGIVLKADREEQRLLEKEKRADLAAMLTPAELLEYDLRASPSASTVRQRLTYFEPTEEEYRAITQIQLELDGKFGTSNLSAQEQDLRRAAEKQLPEKIQAVLTPERFADYQVTTDGAFQNTTRVLRSAGLDLDAVKGVVALQRSFTPRIEAVRNQPDLTPAQRVEALSALEQEATSRLTGQLGEAVFDDYRKFAGAWLDHLRPPPAPGTKP